MNDSDIARLNETFLEIRRSWFRFFIIGETKTRWEIYINEFGFKNGHDVLSLNTLNLNIIGATWNS